MKLTKTHWLRSSGVGVLAGVALAALLLGGCDRSTDVADPAAAEPLVATVTPPLPAPESDAPAVELPIAPPAETTVLTDSIEPGSPLAALVPAEGTASTEPQPVATATLSVATAVASATESSVTTPTVVPPTPVAPTPTPLAAATFTPQGIFAEWWARDVALRDALGLARNEQPISVQVVYQPFERGLMVWRSDVGRIYALLADGSWQSSVDTFVEGEPERDDSLFTPGETLQPIRGFGKLWRNDEALREEIGWATLEEEPGLATIQFFDAGFAMRVGTRVYALIEGEAGNDWVERP